jgi:hypothetical protein
LADSGKVRQNPQPAQPERKRLLRSIGRGPHF